MAEISFKSSGIKTSDPILRKTVESPPIGIKTPVEIGVGRSGIFQMNFNTISQIDDNLRNLILTNNGERLGNYFYGANLKPLTTELIAQPDFDSQAMSRISVAVSKYMPFVELDSFNSLFDKDITSGFPRGMTKVILTVRYNVPQLRVSGRALNVTLYCIG